MLIFVKTWHFQASVDLDMRRSWDHNGAFITPHSLFWVGPDPLSARVNSF